MLFPEEDTTVLKTWIVKRLETPSRTDSDVDADVLADYVLALLRHDGGPESVKKLCETELYDFLKDEATPFVEDVFRAITYKSYLPGYRVPPPASIPKPAASQPYSHSQPPAPGTHFSGAAPSFVPGGYAPPGPPGVAQSYGYGAAPGSGSFGNNSSESRKRSYNDSTLYDAGGDGSGAQDSHPGPGGRATKQARRGGSSRGGFGGAGRGGLPDASNFGVPPPEEILHMQHQLGLAGPMFNGIGSPVQGSQPRAARKNKRCRIMEQKGTCTKPGCQFDHGDNFAGMGDPFMGMFPFFPPMPPLFDPSQQHNPGGGKRGRRGGKSQRAADGPVYDKTRSTIIIQGIPDDHLSEDAVRTFFSQFGTVESVDLDVRKKTAAVKFGSWDEANAAYNSPKVIFDNRFVKVFWLKEDGAGSKDDTAEPELDLEEFQRKQDEAQRTYEEKLRKKQEIDQQRSEIGERMRELFERQAKERQKLVTMMAMATAKNKRKSHPGSEDGSGSNTPTTAASKQASITRTDLIRAQLAALEEEARTLGLDPDAILKGGGLEAGDEAMGADNGLDAYSSSTWQPRGGYTARGRGSYRGRGRGSFAGGYTRGKNAAAYAAYSLDNRPRRVAVAGVDFTASVNDEALRQYLLGVGEFAAIDTTEDAAVITFVDRRTAEQFFFGLPRAPVDGNSQKALAESLRKLPGVDTPLELRWIANTPGMATGGGGGGSNSVQSGNGSQNGGNNSAKANAHSFTINTEEEDDDDHNHDYMDREEGEVEDDNDDRHQNMDFDVAGDDGGWDIA